MLSVTAEGPGLVVVGRKGPFDDTDAAVWHIWVHWRSCRNVDDESNCGHIATSVPQPLYSNLTGLEFPLEVTA